MSSRVQVDYGLDLEFSWPRLWLVLPEETRNVVTAARDALNGAASLAAWGILYLLLAPLWWPIGVAGLATVLVAHQQGRSRAASLAQLWSPQWTYTEPPWRARLGWTFPTAA